jgi:hypothetical protein
MKPQKEIKLCLETIEDLADNKLSKDYFLFLQNLLKEGHSHGFYRIKDLDKITTVTDLNHLGNFRKSFKLEF